MPSFSDLDNDSSFQQAIAGLSPVNGTGAGTVGAPQAGPGGSGNTGFQQAIAGLSSVSGGVAGSIPYGGAPQGYGGSGNTGVAGQAGPTGSAPASSAWNPGMGRITPEQVSQQFGADPSVASYWADKINTGGDPNYYIGRLQQDNAGSGPDAKGGLSGGGGAGGGGGGGGGAAPPANPQDAVGLAQAMGQGHNAVGNIGGWDGQKYSPTQMAAPQDYTPQSVGASKVGAPTALTLQQMSLAQPFQGVSQADLQADPSYQFRLSQGLNAVQSSAAAKGLLRSGGTLKGINDYAQNSASTEFGNVYTRKFGEYTTGLQDRFNVGQANNLAATNAYDLSNKYQSSADQFNANAQFSADRYNTDRTDAAHQQNFQNAFNTTQANNNSGLGAFQANTNAQLGQGNLNLGAQQASNSYNLGMANVGLGYYGAANNYNLGMANVGLGYYNGGNSYSLGQGQLGLGYANYGLGAQAQQFYQDTAFPVNTGLAATQAAGGAGQNYANQAGNYTTQAGNAGASGVVGSSNATNNGLAGAYNAGVNAYGLYQYGQRNPNQGMTSGML